MLCGKDAFNLGLNSGSNKVRLIMKSRQILKAVCGLENLLVLKSNGDLLSSGFEGVNGFEEEENGLNLLMENKDIKGISCGGRFTFIVLKNGDIFVFGENESGYFF